jgi:hypothetical protein
VLARGGYDGLDGGFGMKIVVIKSPKFIAGILRMIFKIKKEPA